MTPNTVSPAHACTPSSTDRQNNRRPIGRGFKFVLAGLALTGLTAVSLQAQTQPSDLAVSWDQQTAASLHADGTNILTLHLTNQSDQPMVLTQFAVNNTSIMVPVGPITLQPGGGSDFPLVLEGRQLVLPATLIAYFKLSDGTVRNYPISLSSPEVLVVDSCFVQWRMGDTATLRTVNILNVPAGVKVTGVSSSSVFTTKLEGAVITIVPIGTTQPVSDSIAVITEPVSVRPTYVTLAVTAGSAN